MSLRARIIFILIIIAVQPSSCARRNGTEGEESPGATASGTRSGSGMDASRMAEVGRSAPNFTLKDQQGNARSLSDYSGRIVVLEWINPECPFVQRHYREATFTGIMRDYRDRNIDWLAINSTHTATPEFNRQWHLKYNLPYAILDDSAGVVGRLYGAKTTPHMYVIDRNGRLVYAGGIDNDSAGSLGANRVNYVRLALDDLLSGRAPRTDQSKPYGCSVKYR